MGYVYIRLKTQSCVDNKSSFFHWGYSSKQWRIAPNWPFLGSIRCILSCVTVSGYIFRSTFRSLSDVLCSDECRTKKAFQYLKRMLPLFLYCNKVYNAKFSLEVRLEHGFCIGNIYFQRK